MTLGCGGLSEVQISCIRQRRIGNLFVRYSEGDRTNADDCYAVISPK